MLLSRQVFREAVFKRDEHKCVVCGLPGKDSHHIMERRLFPDGGYYIDNGVTLCADCHMSAEQTTFSPEYLRLVAGIKAVILPPHLYGDQKYDKWGNPVLPNGQRLRGELFDDPSVRKVIARHLDSFTNYVKYPRTYHLPWSEGVTEDDRIIDLKTFFGFDFEVVVTEKMDGENTTLYNDYIHARSVDSGSHYSRDYVKNLWAQSKYDIPPGWRVCGENLWATHSIKYKDLQDYFYMFSIWNEHNICLGWKDTELWAELLGLTLVPVLYQGPFDEQKIKQLYNDSKHSSMEGYVIRSVSAFHYAAFKNMVAKFVRKDHVQTTKHWFTGQQLEKNEKRT
jgi:hypothetical protein